ncbi:MAG: hypothetical protein ACR2LN_03545, partial [Candidatus Levyibacteriota bacterium]
DRASFIMAVSSHFSISATFFHAQLYENYSSIKYAILFFAGYTRGFEEGSLSRTTGAQAMDGYHANGTLGLAPMDRINQTT